jgi:hypothetical protein
MAKYTNILLPIKCGWSLFPIVVAEDGYLHQGARDVCEDQTVTSRSSILLNARHIHSRLCSSGRSSVETCQWCGAQMLMVSPRGHEDVGWLLSWRGEVAGSLVEIRPLEAYIACLLCPVGGPVNPVFPRAFSPFCSASRSGGEKPGGLLVTILAGAIFVRCKKYCRSCKTAGCLHEQQQGVEINEP